MMLFANLVNSKIIGFFRPKFTVKVLIILLINFLCSLIIITYSSTALMYALNFLVTLCLILPLMPLNFLLKQYYIVKAKNKIKKFKNLKVIGVTGSYGKSSTKNLIHCLLQDKYNVLATKGNLNTEIGIAKMILSELNENHDILLLEMGAYKKGEIKKILEMTPLDFSVLMAVSNQHLALFKTRENLMHAKAEIFSNLNPSANLYINFEGVSKEVLAFIPKGANIHGFEKTNKDFKLISRVPRLHIMVGGRDYSLNIFAPYLEANMYIAIKIALELGVSIKQIQKTLLNLQVFENFMKIKGVKPQFIIDDYNSTQDGVLSMLKTIEQDFDKDQKRLFLFSGILELGAEEVQVHEKIISQAKNLFDLILIPKSLNVSIKSDKVKFFDGDVLKLNKFLSKNLKTYDLVYVSGRQFAATKNLIENYEG